MNAGFDLSEPAARDFGANASTAEVGTGPRWPRRTGLALLLILAFLGGYDLGRPPSRQLSTRVLLWGIDEYQALLSPRLAALGTRCRFEPSCSHYGEAVIAHDGAFRGSIAAAWRIMRCAPWTPAGTYDPPPGAMVALPRSSAPTSVGGVAATNAAAAARLVELDGASAQ